jgi:hypothetical protein
VIWIGAIALALFGAVSAAGRVFFAGDLMTRVEPLRLVLIQKLGLNDPFAAERPAIVAQADRKFAEKRVMTLLHVVPGGIFLLLAPLQFSKRIRTRHIRVHRWSGRLLLPCAIVAGLTALYFGVLIPLAGLGEATAIGLFGALFLYSIARAFIAIRKHRVAEHREWMIRVFAIGVAISTVRLIALPLDLVLTDAGVTAPTIFAVSLWAGWVLTVGAAELWIRATRPRLTSDA